MKDTLKPGIADTVDVTIDRERTIGHLLDEEERLLREALLGDDPDDAA